MGCHYVSPPAIETQFVTEVWFEVYIYKNLYKYVSAIETQLVTSGAEIRFKDIYMYVYIPRTQFVTSGAGGRDEHVASFTEGLRAERPAIFIVEQRHAECAGGWGTVEIRVALENGIIRVEIQHPSNLSFLLHASSAMEADE